MKSDTPLDYAAFQLSPKRSRCELFVSSGGNTERIASGLVKPFVTHLKVAEEQVAWALQSIRLQVESHKNAETWFTKGTLERFVRFVSTPEVLELVSTYDAEMSQLEAARMLYSQGSSDQLSSIPGGDRSSSAPGADETKKELLRAIEVRLATVKQDLSTACAHAEAAGFNQDTVADLQSFAERFGATRLNQACSRYFSLYKRQPKLFSNLSASWKSNVGDQAAIRSSYTSSMSVNNDPPTTTSQPTKSLSSSATFPSRRENTTTNQEFSVHANESVVVKEKQKEEGGSVTDDLPPQTATQPSSRRLSVQDRIDLFENKQKEGGSATGSGTKPVVTKPELRRLSSDLSHSATPPAVLRRWSGAHDTSIDLSGEKMEDQKDTPSSAFITEDQKDQTCSTTQLTVSSLVKSEESVGSNQLTSNLEKSQSFTSLTKSHDASLTGSQVNKEEYFGKSDQVKFNQRTVGSSEQDARLIKETNPEMMTLRASPKKTSLNSGSKIQEAFAASQQRRLEVGLLRSQPRLNSEDVHKKDSISTEEQLSESDPQKSKFQKHVPKDDDSNYVYGYCSTPPSGKFFQEGGSGSRQLKGNQELNDELKMKANELEKLFAEHKLRVPGEQPNPTRQSTASDVEPDQTTKLSFRKQVADPIPEQRITFESPFPVMEAGGRNHNYLLQAEVEFSDDSRGKLYDSYMKKRESRLRELWDSNGAEKEAKMKAMNDSIERYSTEMKATLTSWSADRQNSVSSAQRRAEKLRSFNARSSLKREPLDFGQLEDDGDLSGFGISRNNQGKKPLTRTSIPRSATKLASTSGKWRTQPDNPLAQSVPNFPDMRKENTKPYSAVSKAAARSQSRNYTRNRSSNNEEMSSVKEDKSRRSQSLRKSSVTSFESSEVVVLTQPNEAAQMKLSKSVEPKRFLRKNTGIGPGAGSVIAKMKASIVSEAMNNEEEYDKPAFEPNMVKDDAVEEFDTTETEDQLAVDEAESRMSPESETLINSESENGNTSQSFSQVDHTSAAELPTTVTSSFPVQDSPVESPMSWNSHTNYPFSYTHEASDIESPMRSPASWNLLSTEDDAARMRRKWGIAQKPSLVANSSGFQSRKDMTKGFKRLLKFGRKSRHTDNLADYISATTSEGDDDTEDGRDPAYRSSEDPRKSRMGYSHGLSSEVSFGESDFYGDEVHTLQSSIPTPPANFRLREDHISGSSMKAPRSFFSLSSFRSKGSESKSR